MPPDSIAPTEAARLCLDCGLCCSGVLFDEVRLERGDNPKALTARGLKIKKGQWFNQPCTALCGTLCQLYEVRPHRCRKFVCRQFQQAADGTLDYESARLKIEEVKQLVAELEGMLLEGGGGNVRKPLAQRYATALATYPEALASKGLTKAMARLQAVLEQDFRIG